MKLSDIFEIKYGVNLELINCEIDEENGIPFVARTSENNGVVAKVKKINGIKPNPAGSISCAGGGSVLSTFLQEKEYYSGRDLYYLVPKDKNMTREEKLYYCTVISQNKYRYNYGRQANKTLKDIVIPDTIPSWIKKYSLASKEKQLKTNIKTTDLVLDKTLWKKFLIKDLFDIERGQINNLNYLSQGTCPVVSAYGENQGIAFFANVEEKYNNCFTASMNGSKTGYITYHGYFFNAGSDCGVLKPKFKTNLYIGLFIATVMKKFSFKYMYGRKLTIERLNNEIILLPVTNIGELDLKFMENYIKSLPYGDKI